MASDHVLRELALRLELHHRNVMTDIRLNQEIVLSLMTYVGALEDALGLDASSRVARTVAGGRERATELREDVRRRIDALRSSETTR